MPDGSKPPTNEKARATRVTAHACQSATRAVKARMAVCAVPSLLRGPNQADARRMGGTQKTTPQRLIVLDTNTFIWLANGDAIASAA